MFQISKLVPLFILNCKAIIYCNCITCCREPRLAGSRISRWPWPLLAALTSKIRVNYNFAKKMTARAGKWQLDQVHCTSGRQILICQWAGSRLHHFTGKTKLWPLLFRPNRNICSLVIEEWHIHCCLSDIE